MTLSVRFQSWPDPSPQPVTRVLQSGLKATPTMSSGWFIGLPIGAPSATFQSLADRSMPPVTIDRPSGLNSMHDARVLEQ